MDNWKKFLNELIVLYNKGMSERQISAEYRGKVVEWEGYIGKVDLDQEYVPGIHMRMGEELIPISLGKVLRSNHLALSVLPETLEAWRDCKEGDFVKFKARIPEKSGPFTEITLSEYEGDPEVVLMMGLVDGEILEIVKSV